MTKIRLGVNIDHVATVRQARKVSYPDLLAAARLAMDGGGDAITVHLREDRRHVQDDDVRAIRKKIAAPLNLEMALAPDVMAVAIETVPDQATLVPERRDEVTTEGGLDVAANEMAIREAARRLIDGGIACVSLFIEPDPRQIKAAVRVGAQAIEIHTGAYANAVEPAGVESALAAIRRASEYAAQAGLHVFAGHGLHYANVGPIGAIPEIEELNIGHSIVSRAIMVGLREAVAEMKASMRKGRR